MMKVLGIVCSPRKGGNTEILVKASLAKAREAGAEIELVTLAGKTVNPCDACYSCKKTGKCHIKDDMQDIYTKLLDSQGIIFGTPVYFYSLCAQAKALIDRTFLFSEKRELQNKVAAFIVATGRTGSTSALAVFNAFAIGQKMTVVGRAVGFGGREKDAVLKDARGLDEAETLGATLVTKCFSYTTQ
ncbi:flavodoxin family protein [Chloroflexota bacterium]